MIILENKGRTGLYKTDRVAKYNLSYKWLSSWGPKPSNWYDASTGNFLIDRSSSKDFSISTGGGMTYSTTQNGLSVLTFTNFTRMSSPALDSYYTTDIIVVLPISTNNSFAYEYNINPGQIGPGGGGNYNSGKLEIRKQSSFGGNTYIDSAWSYSSSYPSEQYIHSRAVTTLSTSTFSIVSASSEHDSSPVTIAKVNGSSISAGSSLDSSWGAVRGTGLLVEALASNKIAEALHYDSILTSAQIISLEFYLRNKWGL